MYDLQINEKIKGLKKFTPLKQHQDVEQV